MMVDYGDLGFREIFLLHYCKWPFEKLPARLSGGSISNSLNVSMVQNSYCTKAKQKTKKNIADISFSIMTYFLHGFNCLCFRGE